MTTLYKKEILVRFSDCDPQGILFFAQIQKLSHDLIEEFCAEQSFGWKGWFQNPEFAVPLKSAASEFHKPIPAGARLTAVLNIENLGVSSVVFVSHFFVGTLTSSLVANTASTQGEIAASCKTVHVFVDRKTFKKIAIPQTILAHIKI